MILKSYIKSSAERFFGLSLFYRTIRDSLDQYQKPIVTPWGFTIAGHEEMAAGNFEPEETAVVRGLIRDIDVLINVGANVGYYCCHALSLRKTVIAMEPNRRNFHYLLKNIQNNGWSKMAEVFPIAVGASTDILRMWGGDWRVPD